MQRASCVGDVHLDRERSVIHNITETLWSLLCTPTTLNVVVRGLLQFVGYKQPYSRIRYELDFLLGAEVDLGCGTAVVGNGAGDPIISKDVFAHPLSMHRISYQWLTGRGNLKAEPPTPGFYPQGCPRYHRFRIVKPGNFTFVRTFTLPLHTPYFEVQLCKLRLNILCV